MLYQHEDIKIAVRLLANGVHIQEHVVTASPTGIHNEQRWTCLVPITTGQTLALEYRIIGLKKSCMVDVKVDGTWRFRTTHGPDETVRQLVDNVIMKEQHLLYYAKMCAKDQSNPDPYGSDDGEDDDFAPVKGSPAFEVGNIELLFFVAQPETGNTRYTYRKGPYFENDPERGFTQRAASDSKLTSKVYEEAGPATCSINLLKDRMLSEIEDATAKFEAKRPLLSSVPFVTFKFLYRDQRVLSYECDQPSQDITSAAVSSGFWAITPFAPVDAATHSPAPAALQQQPQQPQDPRKRGGRGGKQKQKRKEAQKRYNASTDIGAGVGQMPQPPNVTYPTNTSAPNASYPSTVRNPPLSELERHTTNDIPSGPELITPSSPVADTVRDSLPVASTAREPLPIANTARKSSLAKSHQGSNRRIAKTVRFAPEASAETRSASDPPAAHTPYVDESSVVTPASPADDEGREFSAEEFIRCLSTIGDRSETGSQRLKIGNLGPGTTEQDLRDLFQGFTIRNVEIPLVPSTQKPATYGYVTINIQAEADRAMKELAGKMVRSRPVTITPLGKFKSTEPEKRPELEKRPETDVEATIAAEAFLDEFVPDVLRNDISNPPLANRGRLGSPPRLARGILIEGQIPSSVNAPAPGSEQNDRLASSIQTRKRNLEEMEQFQEEMEAFRKRQRAEMEDFHKRQREEIEEFQKRQREEIEEKMENWKAETADMERTAKRRKIVLDRSAESSLDTNSQAPVGTRAVESNGNGDGVGDIDGVDPTETGAPDSTNTTSNITYGPHELNLRAISERLGRIDDLKSRQADGETLETSDLLEIKMEEQVRLELSKEIKSSPGLEPRTMEDMDQDLPQLDAPGTDQADGMRNALESSSMPPWADPGHDEDETAASRPDVKLESREFGETPATRPDVKMEGREFGGTSDAHATGTSRAEKTKVYIKLEDDDD